MYGNVNRTARARSDTGQAAEKNALGNVRLLREASEPMQIMAHFERRRAGNAARAQASPYSKERSRSYPMGIQSIAFRRRMRPHKRRVIKKRDKQRTRIRPVRTQTGFCADRSDRPPAQCTRRRITSTE